MSMSGILWDIVCGRWWYEGSLRAICVRVRVRVRIRVRVRVTFDG